MTFLKRIFFFTLVNLLIMVMATFAWTILSQFLGIPASDYMGQMIFMCLAFGMGGAFLSLWMSKFMAKQFMGVQLIDPQSQNSAERALVDTVHQMARAAHLKKMPEVGIYDSPEINAFATGPSKNNSLVAVSTGLLHQLDEDEVKGVLGHEVAHIANGDMVTMTLLQGIINAFVMFLARILANFILRGDDDDGPSPISYMLTVMGLQLVFGLLGSLVVNAFSRWREFRADAGGARLAGRDRMISALQALQRHSMGVDPRGQKDGFASLKISSGKEPGALAKLFSTHPDLSDRIRRLEKMQG